MFTIRFYTQQFRPNHSITISGSAFNNWGIHVPGLYQEGAWIFTFEKDNYPNQIEFKFRLDCQYWQEGANNNVIIPFDGAVFDYTEANVNFPATTEIFVENSRLQRHFLQPNLDESEQYDVIVIGSGMGGGIVAEQLADFGKKVLVLEAGSYLFPTHVGNLPRRHISGKFDKHLWQLWPDFQTKNFKNPEAHVYQGAAGFNLGGRSVFWGALIPRPAWWELEPWPDEIRYQLEDVYFDKAENLMKLSRLESSYQSKAKTWFNQEFPNWHVTTAPMAVQRGDGEARTLSAGVFNTASLLMEAAMTDDTDLTINLNHAVNQLLVDEDKITGVRAYDLIARQNRTYQADKVILAAGSIESSKIVQLSGLQTESNKVGKGFTDHPIFFTHFAIPVSHPLYDRQASSKITARMTVTDDDTAHRFLIVIELGADFNQGRYIDPEFAEKHTQDRNDEMLCEIVFLCESPLVEENEVTQNGPDYEDVDITMQASQSANNLIDEMTQIKNEVLNKLNATVLENDNHFLNLAPLGGVAHEVGTLRLGENAQGVVDTQLKFDQYENLYCCDLSVFPNSLAANPSLTLAALALRLADTLREDMPP
ncbi:GMC oxidoreductase [Paraglaciecola marina]|uniref:GMC oxidoreductase n=1 Tax=Paraglaciecola marina TaxID=2500157 RepID=UPI00106040CD|nr:GMC family oxidoreductase [Paraglaciecola marina]